MLTENEILEIANKYMAYLTKQTNIEIVISNIIEKEYGKIYHFTSKKLFETKDEKYAVAGNGPFLVEKKTGKVIRFGTAYDDNYYIEGYEKGTWEPALNSVWEPEK